MRAVILICALFISPGKASAQEKTQRSPAEIKALENIRHLGGLALELAQNDPRLEVSYLQTDQKFSDAFLLPLKDLPRLVHLNLRGLEVTDANAVHLKGLAGLTRLHLERTKITDRGMENLKDLVNLEYLNLYGTEITDKGLEFLQGMKKLKSLYLWQTKVTDAGVEKLKKALPQVEIVRGFEEARPREAAKPVVAVPAPVKPGPEFERLRALVGSWDAVLKVGGGEFKGIMTYKLDLGGLWVASEFKGMVFGQNFEGKGLDTYDPARKKYISVWADSMAPIVLNLEGSYDQVSKKLIMTGEGPGPDGKVVKYKTVNESKGKDTIVYKMFLVDKSGKEQENMAITFTRKK